MLAFSQQLMANPSLAKLRKLQEHAQALWHDRPLPMPDESEMTPGRKLLLFCVRVYHSFGRNRCPVRAAALAYTNLLALVPLLAVAVSVSAGLLKSQGEQSIQDWIREAITRVAPMLGLQKASGDSALFTPDDFAGKDLDRLISRIESGQNPVARFLWDTRFTEEGKNVLTNVNLPPEEREQMLAAEFNKVVQGGSIWETQRFAKVQLSWTSRTLLTQNPTGPDLARLNHALLADAFRVGEDALDTVTAQITNFVANFQSGKLGVSAVLALIFVAISLLATIETTFNDIWGVTRGRGWFARIVQYWAALTLGPMFFFSAVTVTTWAKVSRQVLEQLPMARVLLPFLVPVVILSLGCALLYLVMPNTRVPWRAALLGGFVAGLLLQLNSYFNVFYVSRVLTYKQIYGSMAALPLFLLGLYLSWLLVLLGAQVTYAFQNRRAYAQERKAEKVSQRGREFLALRLMTEVAERFQAGAPPPSASEMAEHLNVPLRLVGQLMSTLAQGGLVLEVAGAENTYAPGRPLDQITVWHVLQGLRVGQGQELATCDDAARPIVSQEFEAVEETWRQAADALTLGDLVSRIRVSKPTAAAQT